MGERNQEPSSSEPIEDIFEPMLGDIVEEEFADMSPVSSDKQRLAQKRRRAEQRL